MNQKNRNNPLLWVPTLYFAEGIPYFIVNNISVILFTKMGIPNGIMALYTSLLYLPWVIKPFWSPFVDIIKTKRWWIISTQIIISLAFILLTFSLPEPTEMVIKLGLTDISFFKLSLLMFWITAFASATHDIAADGFYMLGLSHKQQSFYVGIRSTFYRLSSIFGQGVLVVIAGLIEKETSNIPLSWTITLAVTSVIMACITIYHTFVLPKPDEDQEKIASSNLSARQIASEFWHTISTFLKKKNLLIALAFMLLYRLPEAFLVKMMNPFLLDPVQEGGLGLSTETVGLIYGTIGVGALTLGGILGGFAVSKWGLKKCLWPMALSLTLPCFSFVLLSIWQPDNIWIISTCVSLDQFGYGFGFTSYMLYLIYFSDGPYKTAHYSLCTAFMALSMMIPGLVAGYFQEFLGYTNFFWMIMLCCLVTVAVTKLIKIDPEYGKK